MAEATATRVRVARQIARDRLGHWVKPPSQQGHPCHHSCCQGKRVHPENMPVRLNRDYLKSLSQDELERELISYQRYSDTHERGYLQIIAEAVRREDSAERKERAKDRRQRKTQEYSDLTYREWMLAENRIQGGVLLNRKGIAAGVSDRSLFSGSEARANRYASDELKEYWQAHPRITWQQFNAANRQERQDEREAA